MTEQQQYYAWLQRYGGRYKPRRQRMAELEAEMRARYQGRWTPEAREAARQARLAAVERKRNALARWYAALAEVEE